MRKSSFLLLLAATLLLAAAAYTATGRGRSADAAMRPRPAFPGLAAHLPRLAWMRIARGGTANDFAAIDGAWTLVEKSNYPAAPERVRGLLRGLAELVLIEPKTRRRALYGRLGLDEAPAGDAARVSLQDATGQTVAALIVGREGHDVLGSAAGTYVRIPGSDQSWLARGRLDVGGAAADWLDRRILDIPPARIASISLARDGAAIVLRRERPEDQLAAAPPSVGAAGKNGATSPGLAAGLTRLRLEDVLPAAALAAPAAGVTTASFTTFDGLRVEVRLRRSGGRDWAALDAVGRGAAAAEAASINRRLARWVYAMPPPWAKLLRAGLMPPAAGKGS